MADGCSCCTGLILVEKVTAGYGYDYISKFLYDSDTQKAGTRVYNGALATEATTASDPYK